MGAVALFSIFVILFLFNVPVAISLAGATIIVFLTTTDFSMYMAVQRMFTSLFSPPLLAIPGFVFAGVIMAHGGISKYLIDALRSWVGHLPGGLSVVTILACMLFAAISGSSPATAAAIGAILIPAMVDAGYDKKYSMGLVAAGGTLGILIPPSIILIMFGITAEISIGKLFMAGIIPGFLLGGALVVAAIIYAIRKGYGGLEKASWNERWRCTGKAVWGAVMPFLILGSIYSGVATPTESAVIAIFYSLFVSIFIYKEIKWKDIRPILREAVGTSAMIYLIIAAAMLFGLFLTNERIPNMIAEWIAENNLSVFMFFVVTQIMFFVMGTFLEAVSVIVITLPILLPIIYHLGIDPFHFAIVMTVNMELAMITPPVGLNLFVVSGIARARLEDVIRGVFPFLIIMVAILILLAAVPQISLYLPSFMD